MSDIVVALNQTDEAAAALRFAHRLATAQGHHVVAVDAVTNPSTEHTPGQQERYLQSARVGLLRWLTPEQAATTEVIVTGGDVADAVTTQAETRSAAAVVIGSTTFEGVTGYGLGSLAHLLAHRLSCPLATVPAAPAAPQAALAYNIVVGVDGSEASEVALHVASDLAHAIGGAVCAVYTVDDIYSTFSTHGYYGAQERLVHAEIDRDRSPVCFIERLGHHPYDVLADVAHEQHAMLVVVSAKEHHAMAGTSLGNIPDHLLHHPPCPVMILPKVYTEQYARHIAGALPIL